jgi:3-oxoacid CoA-transferase A subunit
MNKKGKFMDVREAIGLIKPGSRIMVGGFGGRGCPYLLIEELANSGIDGLTIISNDLGSPGIGLGKLLTNKQIKALIGNYYNWNTDVPAAVQAGEITVELLPQGTFAEAIRAAGMGIPAFYTSAGVGTELAAGKEVRVFDGKEYLLEKALYADVALVKAYKSDEKGNLVYYKTARNFNPLMAMAAKLTIVECEEIVPTGQLDPEHIVTPHIFTNVICKGGEV